MDTITFRRGTGHLTCISFNKELLGQNANKQHIYLASVPGSEHLVLCWNMNVDRLQISLRPKRSTLMVSTVFLIGGKKKIHGNFKAKGLCQTRLNVWRNGAMFPWVRDIKPSFETKTSSLRSFQYKILEIYWCTFHMSERAKLKPGLGVLLSKVTISLHSTERLK